MTVYKTIIYEMKKIMFCETNILNGKKEEQNKNLKEKRERDVKQ